MKLASVALITTVTTGLHVVLAGIAAALTLWSILDARIGDSHLFTSVATQFAAATIAGICSCVFLITFRRYSVHGDNRRALARVSLLAMFGVYSVLCATGYASPGPYPPAAALILADTLPWLMFYATFAIIPRPLDARTTRVLAGLIAIWNAYNIYQRVLSAWQMRSAVASWPVLLPVGFLISATCMLILLVMIAIAYGRKSSDPMESLQDLASGVVESDRPSVRAGHRILGL